MDAANTAQSSGNFQSQQNIPLRARSPSSPMVLSRPTTSRRKASLSPSELKQDLMGTSPPKQLVGTRGLPANKQYILSSATMKPRPIHSLYSASQPHLNAEELDVKYRSKSHTLRNSFEQRNRWSIVGIEENPENGFNSGSLGRSYDLTLTKRSVEDLRPRPIPIAAPKVPPRRGSRLTTVSHQKYQESGKVQTQGNKHRETRSCEDILESVSTAELKPVKVDILNMHGHYAKDDQMSASSLHKNDSDIMNQCQREYHQNHPQVTDHQNLAQPNGSVQMGYSAQHGVEAQQARNPIARSHVPNVSSYRVHEVSQIPMMPVRSHPTGVSYTNETENIHVISTYSRQPHLAANNWAQTEDQRNVHLVSQPASNASMHYTSQQVNNYTESAVNSGSDRVNTAHREDPCVSKGGDQRNSMDVASDSRVTTEYAYTNPQANVADSAYSSDAGFSSTVSQQSSPPPPIDLANDANLSMTPHTSCCSPSPSPQSYGENKETVMMTIPQSYQPYHDNNSATTTHIPHYAIPTNLSNRDKQQQYMTQASSDPVQSLTVALGGPHSYRLEPDQALLTPSNSEFYQNHPQDMHSVQQSQAAMTQPRISAHLSLSQPVAALSASKTSSGSSSEAMPLSQGVSQRTEALAQAFSQWQYHSTAKGKQGSSKQSNRSESKPPIKPKPASLMKGAIGSVSLKYDKNKSQKSAEGSKGTKKSGQKYVFKQSQSRSLLSRGRTPSQVDPLTDVGMEIQYGDYSPQKHHQSSSASSSDSTLRDDLRFTESQREFAGSGPSPNSYDYGSQMTITGDATLTPYSPDNGFQLPPTLYHGYQDALAQPLASSVNGTNVIQTCAPAKQAASLIKPSSPHPCANNGHYQLPHVSSHFNTPSSVSMNDFKSPSALAPIAEVNIESEQSNCSLLNTTEQTDSSQNREANENMTKSLSFDNATSNAMQSSSNSRTASEGTDGLSESEDKLSAAGVQRSSTLPSAYKRPKPYRFNPTKHLSADIQEQSAESIDSEATFSQSRIKLSDFTALNTNVFPKHVRISNPFTCTSCEVKLSQGDVLDLHFIRQTKAVVLVSADGKQFFVPLNNANRFALTYDPLSTRQLVHQGYHFKSVGELMATIEMPTVVIVTEGYNDSKPHSSVEVGEILVIGGVLKQAQGKVLKVNSTRYGRKFLEERCTAKFSTRTDDTKLSLHEMFKASMQLPQQAFIYPPSGLHLPDCLTSAPVTLKQFCVLKSVIATPVSAHNYSPISSSTLGEVYDISLDLDIEIQECCEVSDKQMIEMRTKTQQLYSSFEPTRVIPFYNHTMENREQVVTQTTLFTNVDLKGKFLGMQLEIPEWLGQIRIRKAKKAAEQSQRMSLSQPLLSQNDAGVIAGHTHDGPLSIPSHSSTYAQGTPSTIEQRMVALEWYCKRMDNKLNTLIQNFTEVVKQLSIIKKHQRQLQQTHSENYRGHNQYVEMMQTLEDPSVPVGSTQNSPSSLTSQKEPDRKDETEQTAQVVTINDEQFEGVREWQRKQEKHLQWQQEQVQQWQIECEKQMQEMQQKLTLLEDRQMKFFLETQQKVKQWKAMQETQVEADTSKNRNQLQEIKQENTDKKRQELKMEKPELPPKPTIVATKSDSGATLILSPTKESKENDTKQSTSTNADTDDASIEAVDFGLDKIADNIASWCSQMELELKELYSNSVETN